MKRSRLLIAVLLTIAVPYSAAASMADGFGCRHAVVVTGDTHQQHDHAAMTAMSHGQHAMGDQKCDCPTQCACLQHCAGGCAAALQYREFRIAPDAGVAFDVGRYRTLISDPQTNPPFRPPIVTAHGAV